MTTLAFCLVTCLVTFPIAFLAGVSRSTKTEVRKVIREAGFTKESALLYGRAVKLIRRLHGLTELDGDLAADILSPTTKKQVADWLADHRKLVESGKGGAATVPTESRMP
jgi:hypothetical protein